MNQPAVSIVVPVYKVEKYLRKCLDSLLNQTLKDIEIIAVNDGSPDGCPAILDEYQEKFPQIIRVFHKENGGQATARNMAFQYCSGEYIGFLDSDDYVVPEMFEKMYRKAKDNDADYVACGYKEVTYKEDGSEEILHEYVSAKHAEEIRDLFFGAQVGPWMHLYKRELIIENNIRFPEGYVYEDTSFYLKLIPYLHKIALVEEPLVIHVKHGGSTMTIFRAEKVANIFPVLQDTIDFYKEKGFTENFKEELEYFCTRIVLCSSMQRISMVKPYKEAKALTKKTMDFLQANFPRYRKNHLLHNGAQGLYMRSINKMTIHIYLCAFRIMNKFKRTYT